MSGSDELRYDLTSDPHLLGPARDALRAWIADHGWDEHRSADIVLAVDEALTNVIRHGYCSETGRPIEVHARVIVDPQQGEGVEVVIRDYARQVPLEKICGRDLDDLRPGGLGVHIIRSLMDQAVYSHADGGGMRLSMRKFKSSTRHTP